MLKVKPGLGLAPGRARGKLQIRLGSGILATDMDLGLGIALEA